ncbi:hypothetical protein [Saccharopolyspora hattusasensis]|uniref:hypothetical protein n=1 Tax=Saccharopolyspora hattusasensis TaxID=1128679 RepID=UPI003D96C05E
MPQHAIILSDYFNSLYTDGVLAESGKAKNFDGETLIRCHPDAEVYQMGDDVYNELLNGDDYPPRIEDVPLGRLERIR